MPAVEEEFKSSHQGEPETVELCSIATSPSKKRAAYIKPIVLNQDSFTTTTTQMESIFGQSSSASQTGPAASAGTAGGPTSAGTSSYISGQYSMPQGIQNVQLQVEKARNWLQNALRNTNDTLRHYINQYPPLAAFLFTLLVLSAVPVSIFVIFGVVTTVFFLSIALIGFAAVEGTILLTGGGVLLAILSGVALFTTCAFGFLAICYLGYRGSCSACNQLWQGASYVGGKVQEQAQYMQQAQQAQQQQSSGPSFTR